MLDIFFRSGAGFIVIVAISAAAVGGGVGGVVGGRIHRRRW